MQAQRTPDLLPISETVRLYLADPAVKSLTVSKDEGHNPNEFAVFVEFFPTEYYPDGNPRYESDLILVPTIHYNEVYAIITAEMDRPRARYGLHPTYDMVGYSLIVKGAERKEREHRASLRRGPKPAPNDPHAPFGPHEIPF